MTHSLANLATSLISDAYGDRLLGTVGLSSFNTAHVQVVGKALTVKVAAGDNLFVHKALDLAAPNDILVIDGGGDISRALVGELLATRARGLIAIPPHLAEQVAQAANEKKQLEDAKRIQFASRATLPS